MELYIGSPIEHASERDLLDRLVQLLCRGSRPAMILANISLQGRQIDFVVAFDHLTLVIEAKGYTRPVRGGENGPWQVQVASGDWKDIQNPYLQARDAAYALRDAMRSLAGAEVPYPSAALVFVPNIPRNSQPHTGDFKVSVIGLDGLGDALQKKPKGVWPLARWSVFAQRHRLTEASTPEAACDPALVEADSLIAQYTEAFGRTYTPASTALVPFTCRIGDEAISTGELVRLVSEQGVDILMQGPSGCGKSLLAAHAGLEFGRHGGIAVFVSAKDYHGSLKAMLDQEAGLLEAPSAGRLLGAARRLNRPVLFILDGYNECMELERASLTRRLSALAGRYEANVLVTSQCPLARGDLLALRDIEIPAPSYETKVAIARNAAAGNALTPEMEPLLHAVASGLEARLVGEVGWEAGIGNSRYALFDAFVRKRLGAAASDGIRALANVAAWLSERVTFSLSVRDLDRIAEVDRFPASLLDRLRVEGLLVQRGDRVSFGHELFMDAFATESIMRHASGRPEDILAALTDPRHVTRKELIVGAIDDDRLLEQVLERLTDSTIVASCLSGACGRPAREWAESRRRNLLERVREETGKVRFMLTDQGWWNVSFEAESLTAWSQPDRAFIAALPEMVAQVFYLDAILDIIAVMDQRIAGEWHRLRDEARERKIALRSPLFANSYVFQSTASPGITQICSHLRSGLFRRSKGEVLAQAVKRNLAEDDLSPGQLYLLLGLYRQTAGSVPISAQLITHALQRYWASAPYHLGLDLMETAGMCWQADESDRAALIEAIEAIPQPQHPFLSTVIVEALQSLGALDAAEREHAEVIREEVRQFLANPDGHESCTAAYRNRTDLDEDARCTACRQPLSVLARHELGASVDAIRHCEHALVEGVERIPGQGLVQRSIVNCFPVEVTKFCRQALKSPSSLIGYFTHFDRRQVLGFCIQVLGNHGNVGDLMLLRRFATDPSLGTSAVKAVKMLEDRSISPS